MGGIPYTSDQRIYQTENTTSQGIIDQYLLETNQSAHFLRHNPLQFQIAICSILRRMISNGMEEGFRTEISIRNRIQYMAKSDSSTELSVGTQSPTQATPQATPQLTPQSTAQANPHTTPQSTTYTAPNIQQSLNFLPTVASSQSTTYTAPNIQQSLNFLPAVASSQTDLESETAEDTVQTEAVEETQYKLVHFGKLDQEISGFIDDLGLDISNGFKLLDEPLWEECTGFYLRSLQMSFDKNCVISGTWEDFKLKKRYDATKMSLEATFGGFKDDFAFQKRIFENRGLEEWNQGIEPQGGNWYYICYGEKKAASLIVPFNAFETIETEQNTIKKITVFFGDISKEIDVDVHTTLENIWEELTKNSSPDLVNAPSKFSFEINSTLENADDYDPDVDIGSHSAVRFFVADTTARVLDSRYTLTENLDSTSIYKTQRNVGLEIFKRFQKLVDLKQFKKIRYCVATAGYSSLREQTKSRMEEFGLDSEDVWICNAKSGLVPAKEFHAEAIEKNDTLFVMICDESHWGINANGVYERMMNGVSLDSEKLRTCDNFIQLFVSATPYNLLTKNTRIPNTNIIKWEDAMPCSSNANAPEGFPYIGLDSFLCESENQNWSGNSPIRSDERYEACLDESRVKPVEALAGEYLLSILKAHVHLIRDIDSRWLEWTEVVGKFSKADAVYFNSVLNWYKKDQTEEQYVKSMRWPDTETDRIIDDLMKSNDCMKVVRIAPGEDKDSGAASDKIAKKKFLDPIRKLLERIKFDKFILLGDFGNQKPQKMLTRPMYANYWKDMQSTPCQKRDCECASFTPAAKNEKCGSCKHIHKNFNSYSDLGGLPVLLVIVMKGRLGDTFPPSFSTLDMRATKRLPNNVNLSSLIQELGRLCFHSDKIPKEWNRAALVSKNMLVKLKESKHNTKGISYRNLKLPIDSFVDGLKNLEKLGSGKPTQRSMDHGNNDKWVKRVLLWAEPQNGKTGAFIWFLRLLLQHVENIPLFEEKTEVVIPQPDYEMPSPHEFYPNWFFPFKGKSLGTLRPYNKLLTGKYHKPVAKRRIRWKMRSNHVSEFKDLILKHEGPLSKEAFQMLSATTEKDVNWDGFLFREGNIDPETFCDFQILRKEPSNFVPLSAASGFPLALPASLTAGINFTEKEFELSRIQIEPKLLKVSLPGRFRNLFETQSGPRLWSQAHIVLTPSYQVRDKWWVDDLVDQTLQNSTPDPSKCRLNFGNNIIHILLVRSSQYEAYQKAWGNTHIIIKLPDKLRYLPNHKLHMQNNEFSVEDGGVGFARLVGQIWAYERNIEHCFMFDDNVICCFELMKAVDSTLSQTPVPFTRVMDQMTAILTKNSKELSTSEQEYYMLT